MLQKGVSACEMQKGQEPVHMTTGGLNVKKLKPVQRKCKPELGSGKTRSMSKERRLYKDAIKSNGCSKDLLAQRSQQKRYGHPRCVKVQRISPLKRPNDKGSHKAAVKDGNLQMTGDKADRKAGDPHLQDEINKAAQTW